MKRLQIISLLIICLKINAQDDHFFLNGTISDEFNNKYIMLFTFAGDTIHDVDTAIIKNGRFSFTGKEYILDQSIITTGNYPEKVKSGYVFLERGNINIDLSDTTHYYAYGTYLNNLMILYNDTLSYYENKFRNIDTYLSSAKLSEKEANEQSIQFRNEWEAFEVDFKKKNINNIVGKIVFLQNLNYVGDPNFDEIYAMLDNELKSNKEVIKAKKSNEEFKVLIEQREKSIGKEYANMEFETPDNERGFLSNFIGKSDIHIIDFWASWCGPCITEIPHLKEMLNKYEDKVSIVSISIDENKHSWLNALRKLNMPWTQLIVKSGEDKQLREKYYINGIPHIILLDRNGKIIQINLRGIHLDKYIEFYLKSLSNNHDVGVV